MIRAAALCLLATPALADAPVNVPSGQQVSLHEVLTDTNPGALWVRFRFLAPGIARAKGEVSQESAAADMDYLCDVLAVAYVRQHALRPERVVISMADRPVVFGKANPEATQFFSSYSLAEGRCIWEEF